MRLLVSCNECLRRYTAEPRKVGTNFRCHCGEVLHVRQPKGHTASVVRCSSCGGVREGNSRNCGYCGGDFTLHERDLNTVCPNCFARASDSARFCPQCGDALSGESVAGDDSNLVCPVCPSGEKLASRRLGQDALSVLECQYCTGLWIGLDAFNTLRNRARAQTVEPIDALFGRTKPRRLRPHVGPMYRKCLECGRLMSRRQYAKRSGVIIDVCRKHGIWFDPEELHQVLRWIAEGGRAEPKEKPPAVSPRFIQTRSRSRRRPAEDFLDAILGLFVD